MGTGDLILIGVLLLLVVLIWFGWRGKSTWERDGGDDEKGRNHRRAERNDDDRGGGDFD